MNDVPSEFLQSVERLTRDLRNAAVKLSDREARFLVDAYYQMQRDRIRAGHQERTLAENAEPHDVLAWLGEQRNTLEKQIARALDAYSDGLLIGRWARCAPPGALVEVGAGQRGRGLSSPRQVPIEHLVSGDRVTSFNRHHAAITSPRAIITSSRHYSGDLIGIEAESLRTETTPNHQWLVRLNKKEGAHSVYLMRSGSRYRVGRCELFISRGEDRLRLGIQRRATRERADVWLLKMLSTDREAAIYEQFISTEYGLSEWPFRPPLSNKLISNAQTHTMFAMLDAAKQRARAERCLLDHELLPSHPLYSWANNHTKQSGTQCIKTAAANLIPEIMEVPLPLRRGKIDWRPITNLPRRDYDGIVHSLDVEQHHTYIQDGIITCNSITGIGPIIAAGLAANIDIRRAPTVGHIWRFAGLDPTVQWKANTKRPWNGALKRLCFLIGESFVKVSGRESDVYGKVYAARKELELARNEAGAFAAQAATSLAAKKWRDDTTAKKAYETGKLPQARIHLRAERYAVKLFLAHYHHVAYEIAFGLAPPKPYILAAKDPLHTRFISPPNWPMSS